jgi:hypothetical protein
MMLGVPWKGTLVTRRSLLALPLTPSLTAQFGPPPAPSFEQIESRLRDWARAHPRILRLEVAGRSVEGRNLYALHLTDPDAPADQKEHVLMTALHAGQEQSGATSVLSIVNWLLSPDPLAREILRRQSLLVMPVVNPDLYVRPDTTAGLANALGKDPYTGWNLDGPLDAERCPEAAAVHRMLDQHEAEVHTDLHGLAVKFAGIYMLESSTRAFSNISLRPYHAEITRLMDEAALAEGYPSDKVEEDAERIFGGGELGLERERVWAGVTTPAGGGARASTPRVYAAIYGYNRFHSLILASENCWERSAWLRQRRLLQTGNEIWPGEFYPGYPVRVITKANQELICAWGVTAAERRRSRIELWNKQRQFLHGANRPYAAGRLVYACATSPEAAARWLGDRSLQGFAASLRAHPRMHQERIARLIDGFPETAGQWGPTSNLSAVGGNFPAQPAPIEHGLALRLRVPFPKARRPELWMNGAPLQTGERDGFISWVARGFTYFQINIPPERSRREDFFVVTLEYDPGETRTTGQPW